MNRDEIVDAIENIQDSVDKMKFLGNNEHNLHLREELADYIHKLITPNASTFINFLFYLYDQKLINDHDFDFEKVASKYIHKLNKN
jgi:hypothetical protein